MTEWNMDRWKFFDITHRHHTICNPTSSQKIDELVSLLNLRPGMRVLDIACGKAELLIRLVESFGITGVGVDKSPYVVREAKEKRQERVPNAGLDIVELDGAEYQPDEPESFDAAMCLGATWIWNGYGGTLNALKEFVKPDGLIVVGEPYWIKEPDEEYLASENLTKDMFSTHYRNVAIGEQEGLVPWYSIVSNQDDWDRYEGLQWRAAAEYARAKPDDPDLAEVMERVKKSRESYLRWGRDSLGWAIYLFRKPR